MQSKGLLTQLNRFNSPLGFLDPVAQHIALAESLQELHLQACEAVSQKEPTWSQRTRLPPRTPQC